jgi:ribonuclease VapC
VVIDTSALVAIIRREPEADEFIRLIALSPSKSFVSAVSLVEAGLVLDPTLYAQMLELLLRLEVAIVEFNSEAAAHAVEAARKYGKRSRSKAQLNFGDCCAYGTAKALRLPLLFKGEDFAYTDITPAIPHS